MISQEELDAVIADEAAQIAPAYLRGLDTPETRENFRRELVGAVTRRVSQPFDIQLSGGVGSVNIRGVPQMTAEEEAAREAAIQKIFEDLRLSQIAEDKRRAELHSKRAMVAIVDSEPAISIAGMLEDLRHWRAPPDCINEESYGFARALEDVIRYLKVRERRR